MKRLTIVFCLLTVNMLWAGPVRWHTGVVVLQSGAVLNGEIALQEKHDMILFRKGEEVDVFPAHKIRSVHYYDQSLDLNRRFVSVRQEKNTFQYHQLFEIVLYGDINVLRKAVVLVGEPKNDALDYDYYLFTGSELIDIRKFRSRLYPKLIQESPVIANFIKDNRLCYSCPSDIIKVIEYYNRGQHHENVVAFHQ